LDCVTVCPTDAFYEDEHMLYIDPDSCIDCGACVPECPVGAIYRENDVPEQWAPCIQLNLERAMALKDTGHITEKHDPLEGASCNKVSR